MQVAAARVQGNQFCENNAAPYRRKIDLGTSPFTNAPSSGIISLHLRV